MHARGAVEKRFADRGLCERGDTEERAEEDVANDEAGGTEDCDGCGATASEESERRDDAEHAERGPRDARSESQQGAVEGNQPEADPRESRSRRVVRGHRGSFRSRGHHEVPRPRSASSKKPTTRRSYSSGRSRTAAVWPTSGSSQYSNGSFATCA